MLSHNSHDISTMRRKKVKTEFNVRYATYCKLNYIDTTSKALLGENLSRGLNKGMDITNPKKSIQPDN